jgi:hypothetical protein
VRAYASNGDLMAADVTGGDALERCIANLFSQPDVEYLHLHHAGHGCYLCRVERAGA